MGTPVWNTVLLFFNRITTVWAIARLLTQRIIMKIAGCGGLRIRGCAILAKEKSKEKKEEAQEEREAGKEGELTTPCSSETHFPTPFSFAYLCPFLLIKVPSGRHLSLCCQQREQTTVK